MLIVLPLAAAFCVGCGGGAPASSGEPPTPPTAGQVATTPQVTGMRTFVIIPSESRASYHANEEFFAGAMKLIGIKPGKMAVVGTTQALEGKFQIDTSSAVPVLGDNTFTVRLNTLTSNQQKRDDYLREVRDDGPSFDAYPLATFKATALNLEPTRGDRDDVKYALIGALTIRDITKAVNFDVKGRVIGDTLIGEGRTTILLSTFGIGPIEFADILSVADPVDLEVHLTARAQAR
jgi:polyisoprenoid-binding protein YceI